MIARVLFQLARRPALGRAVGLGFAHGSGLLPVRRVLTTDRVLVFYHPKPAWPRHLLLVPKRPIGTLLDLAAPGNAAYLPAILLAARCVIADLGLGQGRYVLCANGGPRQDVRQVHFHLFTDHHYVNPFAGQPPATLDDALQADPATAVFPHPDPNWETHLLICPRPDLPPLAGLTEATEAAQRRLLAPLARLNARFDLTRRGYTVFIEEAGPEAGRLLLHVTAGERADR